MKMRFEKNNLFFGEEKAGGYQNTVIRNLFFLIWKVYLLKKTVETLEDIT
jgi:hypothetical protein